MIKEDGESGAPRQWATGLSGELDGAAGELARLVLEAPGLELERLELSAGETLFRQGEAGGYLHVVLSGRLGVRQADDDGESMEVGEVGPGEVAGEIQLLTGGRRTATVTALTDVVLARCSQPALDRLAAATPEAARRLLGTIRRRLRRNQLAAVLRRRFGRLDRGALEFIESLGRWRRLRGGEVLFEQGDAARSFFLLVAGRLEAVIHGPGGGRVAGEVVQGESVGEMGVLTSHPRSAMVRALRDSELVEFSREAFERMVCRHPEIVRVMAEVLTDRLARSNVSRTAGARVVNVALVPAGAQQAQANAAVDRLAPMLAEALSRHGAVLLLTSDRVEQLLGMAVAQTTHDSPFDIRLSAWLHEMGRQHRFVILQADPGHTPWTRRCVMFADRVLLAGAAGSDPGLSAEERDLGDAWRRSPAPSRMLVLLHDRPGEFAERTRDWLAPRDDVRHAHLRLDVPGDAERLARLLAGKAVGLTLSGGGARAMAHVGVIRALVEAGVPIDAVGGVSMGGVLAGQYAMGRSPQEMERDTREQLDRLRSPANLSFKLSSVLSSRRLETMLQAACQNLRIEDLWVPFFCTSCNLYTAQLVVHEQGLLRRALYATIALPGVFPPQLESGDVLVDGAILNALPCDVMKRFAEGVTVASDITGAVSQGAAAGRGSGSPAWGGRRKLPSMFDVLQHSAMLGSRHHLERIKCDADVYIPCEAGADHGLLQTKGVERLVDIGYKAGRVAVPRILEQLDEGRRSDVSGE